MRQFCDSLLFRKRATAHYSSTSDCQERVDGLLKGEIALRLRLYLLLLSS